MNQDSMDIIKANQERKEWEVKPKPHCLKCRASNFEGECDCDCHNPKPLEEKEEV
jgi:hypothetical protein